VIRDDDPKNYGNWSLAPGHRIPVQPGDQLTVQWQTAHSIGASGPGQADYGRLKPGSYWFRVAALKANGEPNGQEASLPIEVVRPVYFRWEFWLVLGAVAAGGAAWLGRVAVHRRMQRRIARMEQERALERERARIARDLHDDIGAGLTEIAMQSDWVRRDLLQGPTADTQRRIERVCQSAVSLVRNVDEIVWAVNPANDTLERFVNYLAQSSEQFLEAAGLRVRFDIPEQLPVGPLTGAQRHFLFLAVREALNNAVKHARADLVRLAVQADASRMLIAVEDNGCGFVPEATGIEGTHDGLENMQRRMSEIGGQFHLTSCPGGGTRVEFCVPLAT
jgi:signal transduction histidine kinase